MMGYHVMEYMERLVRKTGIAVLVALLMLVLMGQAQSRRNTALAVSRDTLAGPWSEEFSLLDDSGALRLGTQQGAFPWGTAAQSDRIDFWRSGGRNFFEIACADGSEIRGIRQEGVADTSNGLLMEIRTKNPEWKTWRGASVGMSMEDALTLYPEAVAVYDAHREPGAYRYTYSSVKSGSSVSVLSFTFTNSVLSAIDVSHTDG